MALSLAKMTNIPWFFVVINIYLDTYLLSEKFQLCIIILNYFLARLTLFLLNFFFRLLLLFRICLFLQIIFLNCLFNLLEIRYLHVRSLMDDLLVMPKVSPNQLKPKSSKCLLAIIYWHNYRNTIGRFHFGSTDHFHRH